MTAIELPIKVRVGERPSDKTDCSQGSDNGDDAKDEFRDP